MEHSRPVLGAAHLWHPDVVQGGVGQDVLKLLGLVGAPKVGLPGVANGELVEVDHVHDAHLWGGLGFRVSCGQGETVGGQEAGNGRPQLRRQRCCWHTAEDKGELPSRGPLW